MSLRAKKPTRTTSPQKQEALDELTKEPLQRMSVELPESMHRALKTAAAQQKTTIRELLMLCINEYLNKNSNAH